MKYSQLFALTILIGSVSFGCKKDTGDNKNALTIEDFLPKSDEISKWLYSGSVWVANNGSELTHQIDGGSELYINYGFIEGSGQTYNGKFENINSSLMLYVYNLGSEQNTSTIFEDPDLGLSGAISWNDNPAGTRAKYIRNSGLSQELKFYRDKYLILINIDFDTDESLSVMKQFAYNIDEKIKSATK